MNEKLLNKLAWWIPIRKYRDKFRENLRKVRDRTIENDIFDKFNLIKDDLSDNRFEIKWENRWLCLHDKTSTTPIDIHQTYNVTWFSRILAKTKPKKHIDIGSRFNDTILPLSAFIDIDFYDIRPVPPFKIEGLNCIDGNITNLNLESNSVESISSFSVIEHIGLERYGDAFDPKGDIKAINELIRVCKKNGNIFISLPIMTRPFIQYNAHRVYTVDMIKSYFKGCILHEFSRLNSKNQPINNISDIEENHFSEGLFWFIKN